MTSETDHTAEPATGSWHGNRRIAVVGGGPGAHRFVEALLERDPSPLLQVTVFAEESRIPYDRVALSRRFTDATDELPLGGSPWEVKPLVMV